MIDPLTKIFGSFRFIDILDILLITVLVYQVLVVIRGTRGMNLLYGMLVFFGIFGVAELFGLDAAAWLFRRIASVLPILLVVIFQDEIRRFFEGAGTQAGWLQLRQLDKEMLISVIDRLVTAARKMAEERVGALLVIEREVGLSDYVDTENVIEAKLTVDHLRTIFQPSTPMHDGAVLIRGDRIAAARVFLPLSDNPKLDKELGTRHRAGLGITEQSDAVVIIVSEERGQISLAAAGRLVLNIQPEALRLQLKSLLMPGGSPLASSVTPPAEGKADEAEGEEEAK